MSPQAATAADPLDALAAQHGVGAVPPTDPLDALAATHGMAAPAMNFAVVNGQRVPVDVGIPPPAATTAPVWRLASAKGGAIGGVSTSASGTVPTSPEEAKAGAARQDVLATGAKSAAEAVDPRTREGRRNIVGGLGAAAATAAVVGTAPVTVPVGLTTAALAAMAGAAGGGMTAEAGEQLVGTAPPSGLAALGAGAQQAVYEGIGLGATGLVKALGRRIAARQAGTAVVERAPQLAEQVLGPFQQAVAATESRAATAGKKVAAVTQRATATTPAGPAQHALDVAGQAVDEAAHSGPDVDITPLKAEAQRISEQQIEPPAWSFPGGHPHPVLRLINRILIAEDTVPFRDAHQWKVELSDAVKGEQDKRVRKQLTNLTLHLTGGLRQVLREADHAPYEAATARYAQIAPLFQKEILPKLTKVARTEPARLLPMIKGTEPGSFQMLKDALVTESAAGGDAVAGRDAWDSVRAAWIHDRLIGTDLSRIPDRLAKLDAAFAHTLFEDEAGAQVRTNVEALGRVAQAFQRPVNPAPAMHGGVSLRGHVYGWIPVRKLLRGPQAADVAAWAVLAPERTRAWVAFVSSPTPKTAHTLASLAKASGFASGIINSLTGMEPLTSHDVGQAPPAAVGQPPPAAPARP